MPRRLPVRFPNGTRRGRSRSTNRASRNRAEPIVRHLPESGNRSRSHSRRRSHSKTSRNRAESAAALNYVKAPVDPERLRRMQLKESRNTMNFREPIEPRVHRNGPIYKGSYENIS
jgi:hypothetical protein